jgi:hypothetical protein
LLGNHSVKQQWKGSDRCYAMAQYIGVNNGGEDVFCVVGAVVIPRLWNQLHRYSSDNWEVSHFSTSQNEESFQSEFEVVNSVRSDLMTRQEGRER